MTQPALTVAMSVYNGEAHLAEAIESILAQTFTDFEFLILNDGSTDRSQDIIDTYAARDERIRAIHRENRGLIYSLNQLLDEARAPVIARMDDDDIALPLRFEKQMAFLEANPDHGVVGAWTYDIDEAGSNIVIPAEDFPINHAGVLDYIAQHRNFLCHPVVTYRRDLVQEAGGYHPAFRHCEDLDLWLRLASRTYIANLSDRLIQYRRSADQISNQHSATQHYGAAIAFLAYHERMAGRGDPTQTMSTLPEIKDLDTAFGRSGVETEIRQRVSNSIIYSRDAMLGDSFNIVIENLRAGGDIPNLGRAILRLIKWGAPKRALQLTLAAATAYMSKDGHVRP